jgi:sugar/nucleoside kinase (ribokinase family)
LTPKSNSDGDRLSVLVVGSIALDTVETPLGKVTEVLGGSAVYFATAASIYTDVKLVGVAGTDFPREHVEFLAERGVDVEGLEVVDGETFRWVGRYDYERNVTETLDTKLNVFADFHPTLPDSYKNCDIVFLANIDPDLQCEVLEQVPGAKLKIVDTMNFWIEGKNQSLCRALSMVDIAIMDESEVHLLAREANIITAANKVITMGPKAVIVKRGKYGSMMVSEGEYFTTSAYPVEIVKDPTGAGDSFAGGLVGYLARAKEFTPQAVKRAMIHGTAVSSFTVSEFSIEGLRARTWADILNRYRELWRFSYFDDKESIL